MYINLYICIYAHKPAITKLEMRSYSTEYTGSRMSMSMSVSSKGGFLTISFKSQCETYPFTIFSHALTGLSLMQSSQKHLFSLTLITGGLWFPVVIT